MTNSRRAVLGIGAAVVVAGALLFALRGLGSDRGEGAAPPPAAPSSKPPDRGEVAVEGLAGRRSPPLGPEATPATEAELVEEAEAGPARPPLSVAGVVVDAETAVPVPGATVSVYPRRSTPMMHVGRRRAESAETDGRGRFSLALDPEGWALGESFWVSVKKDAPWFEASVELREWMVLAATPPLVLRGTLALDPPVVAPSEVHLSIWEPGAGGGGVSRFSGRTMPAPDGRFELRVRRPPEPPPVYELQVAVADDLPLKVSLDVETSALTSPEGASVVVRLCGLALRISDENGSPVAGALVRFFPVDAEFGRLVDVEADGAGVARVVLHRGLAHEYLVHGPGFFTTHGIAPACSGEQTIDVRVRSLPDDHDLDGRVVDSDGEPVAGAYVVVWPDVPSDEIAHTTAATTETDAQGRFHFADVDAERVVLHSGQAGTVKVGPIVLPVDGRLATIVLAVPDHAGLHLTVEHDSGAVAADAPIRAVLASRSRGRVVFETPVAASYEFWELPLDDYDVFVRVGTEAYGAGTASLRSAQETEELAVRASTAQWLTGRVLDAGGAPVAGVRARFDHPDWPSELDDEWATAETDPDGRFRVFAGAEGAGTVAVRAPSGEERVVRCVAGRETRVEVPAW